MDLLLCRADGSPVFTHRDGSGFVLRDWPADDGDVLVTWTECGADVEALFRHVSTDGEGVALWWQSTHTEVRTDP